MPLSTGMDLIPALVKTDFQLQQALSYLKAWKIFEASNEYSKKDGKEVKIQEFICYRVG